MKTKAIALAGWYGVLAILLAYVLLSFDVIPAKSYGYQVLNLTGSLGIIAEAASKKDKQPVVLNVVWAAVALVALAQLFV